MKVYFNNSCKICKTEVDIYKKEKIDQIYWIDITDNNVAEEETKKNYKQLLRRLHVEKDGQIFSGAKAFLIVWKYIPKYRILYSIFRQPVLYHIFSGIYEIVAFFLYLKNRKQLKTN